MKYLFIIFFGIVAITAGAQPLSGVWRLEGYVYTEGSVVDFDTLRTFDKMVLQRSSDETQDDFLGAVFRFELDGSFDACFGIHQSVHRQSEAVFEMQATATGCGSDQYIELHWSLSSNDTQLVIELKGEKKEKLTYAVTWPDRDHVRLEKK
ncbi:MAG: hypothetical protein H6585_08340 [Flavobacteriales bacterium]|nr:hypothetical protein [Flavobacteriales bacterium]MCB9448337.1 hypothetical protein [Flavobacteriales bacterium]